MGRAHIYCDACFEREGVGIGIYCEDPPMSISSQIDRPESSNAAECVAAIKAIEAAQRLGLKAFCLYSDSQLVVCWTNGEYLMQSATARKYVPKIRQLLAAADATIEWVPGKKNPADRLSREAIGVWNRGNRSVDRIAPIPMDRLRFKDFASLKCGRDEFSKLRLPKLTAMVDQQVVEVASGAFDDGKDVAACLRWVLRGLPVDKAIRKVKTDLEISENARAARRGEWGLE